MASEKVKMVRVYNDASDKNVAAVKVFADDDLKLFYDKDFKYPVPLEDERHLFYTEVVCEKNGVDYNPLSLSADGKITFAFTGGSGTPISTKEGNAIQLEPDGLYVSKNAVAISKDPGNILQEVADGLLVKVETTDIDFDKDWK